MYRYRLRGGRLPALLLGSRCCACGVCTRKYLFHDLFRVYAAVERRLLTRTQHARLKHGLKSARAPGGCPPAGISTSTRAGPAACKVFQLTFKFHVLVPLRDVSGEQHAHANIRRSPKSMRAMCTISAAHNTNIVIAGGDGRRASEWVLLFKPPALRGTHPHGRQASGARQLWQGRVRNVRGPPCCPSTYRVAALYTRVAETEPMSARLLCSSQMSVHSCRIASLW